VRRRVTTVVVVLGLLCSVQAFGPADPAAAVPWGAAWSGDYATEEWGDPWDFANAEDWDVQARYESPGVANGGVAGGTLNFDVVAPAGGVLIGSAHYGPEALHWGRSTWKRPIDGSAYSTISFRLYSPTHAPVGAVTYFTCGFTIAACATTLNFFPSQGWHTYTLTPSWAGQRIYSLLIVPTPFTGAGYKLDWVRVTRPGGSITPVTEPVPVVTSPHQRSGSDYAATMTGNAWDFNDASDIIGTAGLSELSIANGMLRGCNAGNDPGIVLRLGPSINGNAHHRFSMRIHYEGQYNLADEPGGGLMARLLWVVAGLPG
jgi:hypothetical protein